MLNETLLPSLHHARVTLAARRLDYIPKVPNSSLIPKVPNSSLGSQTPAAFAQTLAPQRGLTLRKSQSSAPAPLPNPPKTAKLKAGVSLTLDKTWGQRHMVPCRTKA